MNYEKLSRGLRYYYDKNIIHKTAGKRYVPLYIFIITVSSNPFLAYFCCSSHLLETWKKRMIFISINLYVSWEVCTRKLGNKLCHILEIRMVNTFDISKLTFLAHWYLFICRSIIHTQKIDLRGWIIIIRTGPKICY